MTQFYLITVQKLMTADDMDVVPTWSAYVAEDRLTGLLQTSAELLTTTLKDAPIDGLRPMTEDEIREWREAQKNDD